MHLPGPALGWLLRCPQGLLPKPDLHLGPLRSHPCIVEVAWECAQGKPSRGRVQQAYSYPLVEESQKSVHG